MADADPLAPPEVPQVLADVSLVSVQQIAAAASMSVSLVLDLVRKGQAPQPAIRSIRFTRWRAADIRAWLAEWAERGSEPEAAEAVVAKARRASSAARAGRG